MGSLDHLIHVNYVPVDGSCAGWDVEHNFIPPAVGHGLIDEGGRRWRVVDVWNVQEKHGPFGGYGVYAFVERSQGRNDRPHETFPEYYGS